jgi:glutaredoxin
MSKCYKHNQAVLYYQTNTCPFCAAEEENLDAICRLRTKLCDSEFESARLQSALNGWASVKAGVSTNARLEAAIKEIERLKASFKEAETKIANADTENARLRQIIIDTGNYRIKAEFDLIRAEKEIERLKKELAEAHAHEGRRMTRSTSTSAR